LRDEKVWEYKRKQILVMITRRDVRNKSIATIVAIEKAIFSSMGLKRNNNLW